MKDKKEKWEIQFEEYQNGGLDKKLEELKTKYDNKEIDIKTYIKNKKEQIRLKQIYLKQNIQLNYEKS